MGSLPTDIIQSVAISNLNSISQQAAMLSNLAFSNTVANTNLSHQNAVANQQSMNELGVAVTGKVVNLLTALGPVEVKSCNELLSGNMLAEAILNLNAILKTFSPTASPSQVH